MSRDDVYYVLSALQNGSGLRETYIISIIKEPVEDFPLGRVSIREDCLSRVRSGRNKVDIYCIHRKHVGACPLNRFQDDFSFGLRDSRRPEKRQHFPALRN